MRKLDQGTADKNPLTEKSPSYDLSLVNHKGASER
jgi:hypothetical protein